MEKQAVISECGKYRYQLSRVWDESKLKVMFIMLNPSTADASQDDPTIRRCINFAKSWGFGGLMVGNLFAYRATNPKELLNVLDPAGEENQKFLDEMFETCETIVCAWGNSKIVSTIHKRDSGYKPLGPSKDRLHYLELSNDGTPKHPLYLKGDLKPIQYKIYL